MSKFLFSKWYMDCIDEKGDAFIGYAAVLNWRSIKINYTNILYHKTGAGILEKTSLKKSAPPSFDTFSLTWTSTQLNVDGKWHRIDPSIDKRWLVSDSGVLDWCCFQPKAHTKIVLPKNCVLEGFGYTELIKMNIEPWKLPMTELRWGRYLSEEDTIVWINWRGAENMNLLFYKGNEVLNPVITDDYINFNEGEFLLKFEDSVVLRNGNLISTLFSDFPGIRKIMPTTLSNIHECKWRSRGFLMKPNHKISQGWIIHEIVRWKPNTT